MKYSLIILEKWRSLRYNRGIEITDIKQMKKLDSNFWRKYFRVYDILNGFIPYKEHIKDLTNYVSMGNKVLDAGSGTGNLSIQIEKMGGVVTAIDFVESGLAIHRTKNSKTEIIKHNLLEKLPFKDATFDIVIANNVLYCFSDQQLKSIITEFYRVLNKGGKLIISNPKINFSIIKLANYHILQSNKQFGFFYTIKSIIANLGVIIKLLIYNIIITLNEKRESNIYNILVMENLLKVCKFTKIIETKNGYHNQNIIIVAQK